MADRSQRIKHLVLAGKIVITVAVIVGVVFAVVRAVGDIQQQGLSLTSLNLKWLAVSCLLYLIGLAPCWLFWYATMHAMGQSPTLWESFRAYYISHLGKYVPGKAAVVVVRAGAVRSQRTDTTVAAICIFVETLTMMAVGACVAAAILCVSFHDEPWLLALAGLLILAAGVPTLPPVVRLIVRVMQVKRIQPEIHKALDGLNYRLMLIGWVTIAAGWLAIGGSLWATLAAIPGANPTVADLPLLIACAALSVVAGFASFIPGGLGMRELVAIAILENGLNYTPLVASLSAVLLRLAWLVAELTILVILYIAARCKRQPVSTPTAPAESATTP